MKGKQFIIASILVAIVLALSWRQGVRENFDACVRLPPELSNPANCGSQSEPLRCVRHDDGNVYLLGLDGNGVVSCAVSGDNNCMRFPSEAQCNTMIDVKNNDRYVIKNYLNNTPYPMKSLNSEDGMCTLAESGKSSLQVCVPGMSENLLSASLDPLILPPNQSFD